MANRYSTQLLATTANIASPGSGASVDGAAAAVTGQSVGRPRQLAVITLTSVVAAGSLSLFCETSPDDTHWRRAGLGGSTVVDADGVTVWNVYGLDRYVRLTWEPSVGADVTLTAAVEFEQVYATVADLRGGAGSVMSRRNDISEERMWDALLAASDYVTGFLHTSSLPLVNWGRDLTTVTVNEAAYMLAYSSGINPDNAGDQVILALHEQSVSLLESASNGRYVFSGSVDQTPTIDEGEVYWTHGSATTTRGW